MTQDDLDELENYANMEGTEIGSYCNKLLDLRAYTENHGMTEVFSEYLNEELEKQLDVFRTEYILEKEIHIIPEQRLEEYILIYNG